ncbi:MAG: hypothetical protein LBI87_12410 [Candidatus Accumulibacter sp.]|jgi:hypothetical protein|nr:hypothetical protein [Accumulibacter sp.]
MDMYFPVDLESAKPPMVIIAATSQSSERIIGLCLPVDDRVGFYFGTAAQQYLTQYDGKDPIDVNVSKVKIKLIAITRQPEHGRLVMDETGLHEGGTYLPDEGYLGKDRVEAIVAVGDDVVKVVVNFVNIGQLGDGSDKYKFDRRFGGRSVDQLEDPEWKMLCPKGAFWKISDASPENSDLASWIRATSLSLLLSNAQSTLTGFTDLSGAALGQTTGGQAHWPRTAA